VKKVTLYTDGACSGNPGAGGYGGILMYKGIEKEYSGAENPTTNNRMELMAVIMGLKKLKEPVEIDIYSDSAYVVNAFLEDWITNWQLNNWKNSQKKPVSNDDLWKELLSLLEPHKVTWHKVKGHADNSYNNRCDLLATSAIDRTLKDNT